MRIARAHTPCARPYVSVMRIHPAHEGQSMHTRTSGSPSAASASSSAGSAGDDPQALRARGIAELADPTQQLPGRIRLQRAAQKEPLRILAFLLLQEGEL